MWGKVEIIPYFGGEGKMLQGDSPMNIDSKGRINVPTKYREDLGETFVITKGLDECLFVFPMSSWEKLDEKLSSLSLSQGRKIQRFFYGSMCECTPDKQGRILIPQSLREYSKIEKELVLVGLKNRAEIWSKEKWEAQNEEFLDNGEEVAEAMEDLGI